AEQNRHSLRAGKITLKNRLESTERTLNDHHPLARAEWFIGYFDHVVHAAAANLRHYRRGHRQGVDSRRHDRAHPGHIFHVEILALKIEPGEYVTWKQRSYRHHHPSPSRRLRFEHRQKHLRHHVGELIAHPALLTGLGANQVPVCLYLLVHRDMRGRRGRSSRTDAVAGRWTRQRPHPAGKKKAAVAYATAAQSVQSASRFRT